MKIRIPLSIPSHSLPEPPLSHYRYQPPSQEDQELASSPTPRQLRRAETAMTHPDPRERNRAHMRDAKHEALKALKNANPNLRSSLVLPKVFWTALFILGNGNRSKGAQLLVEEHISKNGFPKVPRPTLSGPQSHLDPEKVAQAIALQKRITTELRQQRAAKSAGLSYRERMPRDKKPKVTA